MGEPITESSDEMISISVQNYSHVDVPTRLVIDLTEGKITANAFATYVVCRDLVDRRISMSIEKLAVLRRVTLEKLEKHLECLEKLGWLDFTDGITVNDTRFEKPRTGPTFFEKLLAEVDA